MKISFDDKSYVEIKKTDHSSDKVYIIVSAKDGANPLKKITNAVEITIDQLKLLISDIIV